MEEFWVCRHCRSLNRGSANKCYSCKEKYGSVPKAATPIAASAPPPPPPPPAALPPLADFSAAARQQSYLSRPVALPSTYAASLAVGAKARTRSRRLPNPVAAVKGRIAASLARHRSVTVDWLGYLTAVLLLLLAVDGVVLVLTVLPAAGDLLQHSSASVAWSGLPSHQQGMARMLALGFGSLGIASLFCFSVFLAMTTHNATGLGADMPLLTPYRAGLVLPVAVWTQARIAVGLIVPAALMWLGYPIPGLIAGIVAVEIAQRHLDDPAGWLTRPNRLLPDLYAKLGTEGSIDSPMASLWSACFRSANVLAIATYILPTLALIGLSASDALGRDGFPGWQSAGLGPAQLGVALLTGSLLALTAGALVLLIPITVGLVNRQRTRRTLVRVGRSRSWIARPGQGGYTPGPQPEPTDPSYDPLDRVIEHFPTPTPTGGAGSGPAGQGFGPGGQGFGPAGQGFGPARQGFGPGGQGFGPAGQSFRPVGLPGKPGPDQASLYSPSTTSSFPWSDDPSEPPA